MNSPWLSLAVIGLFSSGILPCPHIALAEIVQLSAESNNGSRRIENTDDGRGNPRLLSDTTQLNEPSPSVYAPPEQSEPYDAVIIGAGWAGLRAARVLLNKGIQNILVLEASDYIGGRSKTLNGDGSINNPKRDMSNKPIEIGSEWLYMDTPKEKYLNGSNYLDNAYADHSGEAYFVSSGKAQFYWQTNLSDTSVSTRALSKTEVKDLQNRVWGNFMEFRANILDKYSDVSYQAAAEAYKANYLNSNRDKQFVNLCTEAMKIDFVGDLHEISLSRYEFWNGEICQTHYMSVPGVGFGNVAAAFAESFRDKIQLNSKVVDVDYQDPTNIEIKYIQNGLVNRVISSKTVLITASLGILKAGTINFSPNLPAWKQKVIDNMGFGTLNKCAMQWDNMDNDAVPWPQNRNWFELMTPDDESTGKWTSFFNPTKLKGVPTLIGFISGKEARAMEKQTDEEILNDVMHNLRAMFPTITRPDRVVITRWGQDENVLGAYSFNKAGRDVDMDAAILQRHVGWRLFFAGEATSGHYWWATTTGAWITGEKAALNIVKALNSPSNVQSDDQESANAPSLAWLQQSTKEGMRNVARSSSKLFASFTLVGVSFVFARHQRLGKKRVN